MNIITITGRLVADPEMTTTNTGKFVTKASVAVKKAFKPQEGNDSDFFRVVVWGQSAEYLANYGSKGRDIAITGRMESRKYNDKDSGKPRESWELVADRVELIGGVRDDKPAATKPAAAEEYDPFADD